MNKIWLVIKREYLTRVRNKTFLLSTILLPVVIVLFIAGSVFFASKSFEGKKKIAIDDRAGLLTKHLKTDTNRLQIFFNAGVDTNTYTQKGFDGFMFPVDSSGRHFLLRTPKAASRETMERLRNSLNDAHVSNILLEKNISVRELDSINKVSSSWFELTNIDDKNKSVSGSVNSGIGFLSGILIYITMFIFGAMVMRGVMEEKTNRIAEVIVSSVKPFQLMMGKILGIGAVGLTQLLLWIVLLIIISTVAGALLPADVMQQVQQIQSNPSMMNANSAQYSGLAKGIASFSSVNWTIVIVTFIFYFFGGFLFYASLFAAVGSVINEDPQEAQSLMLPIMMPIIFGFIIMSSNLETPDSPVMVWASIIPFTSPIVMMSRIPSGPPVWELGLSIILLILGFILTTWFAGKVYRTGILLYGKKASWKEMIKWIRKA